MRTLPVAFVLASFLPACQGAILARDAAGAGGGTSASSTAASSATASSSTGSVPLHPSCTFSVSGAMDLADIAPEPVSDFVLGSNMFQCGWTGNGSSDQLVVYLGADVALGVGSFSAPYAGSYNWQHCDAQGCVDYENDGMPFQEGGCSVDITVAPAEDVPGQPIAGTFACASLLSGGPSPESVSLNGSFSLGTAAIGAGEAPPVFTGTDGGGCTVAVSGAYDIPANAVSGPLYLDPEVISCSTGVLGAMTWLYLDVSAVQGPGSYPSLPASSYEVSLCPPTAQGCTDWETFLVPKGAAGCSAEITVAPPSLPAPGQRIAGTYSCPNLVSKADPTRSVTASGSFDFVMQPPPQ